MFIHEFDYDIFVVMRSCYGLVLACIHFVLLRNFRSSMKF